MKLLPYRRAGKRAALALCLGVVALASLSCTQPFLVANFAGTYLPRAKRFALAPIANYTTEPEGVTAGMGIRETSHFPLCVRQRTQPVRVQDNALPHQRRSPPPESPPAP